MWIVLIQNGGTAIRFAEALQSQEKVILDSAWEVQEVLRLEEMPEPS